MIEMDLKAMAKINLGLDVIRRREDGYHQVRMVMQTVRLHDSLFLRKIKTPKIKMTTNLSYLPENEDNLAYRAARLLREEFKLEEGIYIELNKHIPVAAGLAGGSSDAAAVLFGVNRMFRLNLSLKELMERGVTLGADVPYCLMRGTALAEGIGEDLSPLPAMPSCTVLLAKPPINVSTQFVYENLNLENVIHPAIDEQLAALRKGDLRSVAASMGNVLETVTIPHYPVIEDIKNVMKEAGSLNAMMSGSGPTVFGLFENQAAARKAYHEILDKDLARQVYLTGVYPSEKGQRDRQGKYGRRRNYR